MGSSEVGSGTQMRIPIFKIYSWLWSGSTNVRHLMPAFRFSFFFTVGVSQTVYRYQKSSSSGSKYEKELKEHGNIGNWSCRTQIFSEIWPHGQIKALRGQKDWKRSSSRYEIELKDLVNIRISDSNLRLDLTSKTKEGQKGPKRPISRYEKG